MKSLINKVIYLSFGILTVFHGHSAMAVSELTVEKTQIEDRKAVFATVETADVIGARARIGGTVTQLVVDEGSKVEEGSPIATVIDTKLRLRMDALEAHADSLKAQKKLAATALERARKLTETGTIPKKRLEEAEAGFDVIERDLAALQAELSVVSEQRAEGVVRAPVSGRVTRVHVTEGAVILPGEPVATIAAKGYILRLQLPERHARFIKVGNAVTVGDDGEPHTGIIHQVYPELRQGRVIADVTVAGLGDFFVGERVRVYVGSGTRETIIIPGTYLFSRFGVTFAMIKGVGEVVVQPGMDAPGGIEILSGLKAGDILVVPDAR